jgi:uncharacterized protein YfkK (UPF0435 family)
MPNIWIECLKNKYRFEYKGLISVEDLFDLKLEDLDAIYRDLKKQEQDLQVDSLIETADNPKIAEIDVKINVVKSVFNMKKAEIDARNKALQNKAQKQRILRIMQDKEDQELSEKSVEELREIYDSLE